MKRYLTLLLLALLFPVRMMAKAAKTPVVGVASFYAKKHEGRKMANGKPYRGRNLTAASRTLRFGTLVRVFNPENQQSVVVEITDRGPWVKGRIIDLSYSAAKQLGIVGKGLAKVVVLPLPEPEPAIIPGI